MERVMKIEVKILNKEFYKIEKMGGTYYDLPRYQTNGSAAVDLVCMEEVIVPPNGVKQIPTGLAIHIGSREVAGLILPRSGLGTRGLILGNTVGLIDSDYQGELKVSTWNRTDTPIVIEQYDRFAQLMFVPVLQPEWVEVEEFSNRTERGAGGFGSTD
jgi:dUTP pyrophosphatase